LLRKLNSQGSLVGGRKVMSNTLARGADDPSEQIKSKLINNN